jgi:hypothetical protein
MSPPTVSVVMSVFNGQTFLSEAIESILDQTYRDYEFVIIDDGSTDKTVEILAEYSARDARIRVHRHENKGRATSLNIGIELSKGLYIARMDADDVALPTRFHQQIEFMERHSDVIVLGGAVELINPAGEAIHTVRQPLEDDRIRSAMQVHSPIYHPTVFMTREAVLAAGGYRRALLDADDYDLWLRMAELGKLANLGEVILRYRVHTNQVSLRGMRQQVFCVLAARAAAKARRHGNADPLWEADGVTPELLSALGVTHAEIQQASLRNYSDWIQVVERCDQSAGLRITQEFLSQADPRCVGGAALANGWLRVASIHRKQGRPLQALLGLGRAVLARPMVAGRPLKRIHAQVLAALKKLSV